MSRSILIDTNAYSIYKQGSPQAIEVVDYAESIGLPLIVMGELLAGFGSGKREASNRLELQEFLALPAVITVPLDEQTTEFYAQIYGTLRRKGTPIPTNDIWIAALALQHGYALFSYDIHFKFVEGLQFGSTVVELLN